jgi:signal transduction histidine kinase
LLPALLDPHFHHRVVLGFLAPLISLPLALRRTRPLPVLGIVVAASVVATVFGGAPTQTLALLIALYSVAAHTDRSTATRAGLASMFVLFWPMALTGHRNFVEALVQVGLLSLGWMFGAYLGELRGRATRIQHEHELESRRALAEEQARIARELHDVLAHSVSVMVVQAAAAGDVFDSSPDRAREALRSIEATGRKALTELRRVLGVIRSIDGDAEALAPQPGLSRLDDLIAEVRTAGLHVVLRIEGTAFELPGSLQLSAYRIVQEALTNTRKHARANQAVVVLRYRPEVLEVEVTDDGLGVVAAGVPADGAGRGLIGMRERVATFGGRLETGPGNRGGFVVRARFPLDGQAG